MRPLAAQTLAALAALAAGVAACAPNYPTRIATPATAPTVTPAPAPAPAPALSPAPAPISPRAVAPPTLVPRPQATARDQCGAAEMQGLVGRPRTEIPVPIEPSRQRVACTTCPVSEDFNPARLNFFFDAATGLIKEIRCG